MKKSCFFRPKKSRELRKTQKKCATFLDKFKFKKMHEKIFFGPNVITGKYQIAFEKLMKSICFFFLKPIDHHLSTITIPSIQVGQNALSPDSTLSFLHISLPFTFFISLLFSFRLLFFSFRFSIIFLTFRV